MDESTSKDNLDRFEENYVMHKGALLCVLVHREGSTWKIFDVLDSCKRNSVLHSLTETDLVKIRQYIFLD